MTAKQLSQKLKEMPQNKQVKIPIWDKDRIIWKTVELVTDEGDSGIFLIESKKT